MVTIIIFIKIYYCSFLLASNILRSFYLHYALSLFSKSQFHLLTISILIIAYFVFLLLLLLNLLLNRNIIFYYGFLIIKIYIVIFLDCIMVIFFSRINLNIYHGASAGFTCLNCTFLELLQWLKFIY
jgi:hypothetical protein